MICPYCGTHIPDDSAVCPACHSELALTRVLPRLDGSYCKSCGALVPAGATSCPSCGMPASPAPVRKPVSEPRPESRAELRPEPEPEGQAETRRRIEVPEVGESEAEADLAPEADLDDTHAIPRIESAIPSESRTAHAEDRLPRTRAVLAGALASLVLVGGAALFITHPWDPNAYVSHNTTEFDTSMAGFPGKVDKLTGQDSGTASTDVVSGDAQTYANLTSYYKQLGDLAGRVDDNEQAFYDDAFDGSAEDRKKGADDASALSYEVSNLINDISAVDVTSGTYADDLENLKTLGSWLRNRVDALNSAWKADVASSDPSADRDSIEAPLRESLNANGVNTYKGLFDQNYKSWEPTEKNQAN